MVSEMELNHVILQIQHIMDGEQRIQVVISHVSQSILLSYRDVNLLEQEHRQLLSRKGTVHLDLLVTLLLRP